MPTDLRLPLLGDIMTEGRLVSWLQPDGATVSAGQPLYELETDKVSFTVEAPGGGLLQQIVPAGEVVEVGTVVGRLLEEGRGADVVATPAAKRLARELGVDLGDLGAPGRIREADVRAWHAATAAAGAPAEPPAGLPAAPLPYGGRRRAIGERMVLSQRTAAALTLSSEVRADAALEMIEGLNQEWSGDGVVLTLTRLVVKACALALREHPLLNSRIEGDRIVLPGQVNVGVALDQEAGLVVPVLRDADRLSLKEAARALHELTRRAEAGHLTQADVQEGTFTVTSMTSSVVDAFTPIINPPGSIVVRHRVTTLSLTFDHRITDGAPASRFLARIAELVRRPYLLLAGG